MAERRTRPILSRVSGPQGGSRHPLRGLPSPGARIVVPSAWLPSREHPAPTPCPRVLKATGFRHARGAMNNPNTGTPNPLRGARWLIRSRLSTQYRGLEPEHRVLQTVRYSRVQLPELQNL